MPLGDEEYALLSPSETESPKRRPARHANVDASRSGVRSLAWAFLPIATAVLGYLAGRSRPHDATSVREHDTTRI